MDFSLSIELLLGTLAIFLFGVVVAARVVSIPVAVAVALAKAVLPFAYFGFFFNPDWALIDGIKYYESGQHFLAEGYTPLSLFDQDAIIYSFTNSGGQHILYDWYNLIAQWLFGGSYAAPVYMNVALTFVSANLLHGIARRLQFGRLYCSALFVMFALHWELLSWSSIANLKDSLVLLLTVATFYAGLALFQQRRLRHALALLVLLFLFYWIRFYVPLLMLCAVLLYVFFANSGRARLYIIASAALLAGVYVAVMGWAAIAEGIGRLDAGAGMLSGAVKVMLIPRPWSLEPEYTFLLIPSLLHWAFLPALIAGAVMLWRQAPVYRLLLIYFLTMLLFYGAFEELQGARQRVQVLFIYAWAQFHCLWVVLERFGLRASEMHGPAPRAPVP
ncbi:hypothetical protein KY495_14485 [Massilia sp. PAMC28688]|uniref:hypothetical protein n=1 Tax=Massilia sp. PAMC28688 TaxID=2861283 RepID=UPI001C62B17A|nr:hypothetical protein [Massilia sp. PAMC28688]QYF91983.1 hypothetical protein KY495_14485 [Massilia sp. PAMC28688]